MSTTTTPDVALSADDLALILRSLDRYAERIDLDRLDADDARRESGLARELRKHLAPVLVTTPTTGTPLTLTRRAPN